jgi:hypothetical protein
VKGFGQHLDVEALRDHVTYRLRLRYHALLNTRNNYFIQTNQLHHNDIMASALRNLLEGLKVPSSKSSQLLLTSGKQKIC